MADQADEEEKQLAKPSQIVHVDRGEVPLDTRDALGATLSIKGLRVVVTGQSATAAILGVVLCVATWNGLETHATAVILVALFMGFFTGRASANARVLDALRYRERGDREVDRIAGVRNQLEEQLVQARISSKPDTAPNSDAPKSELASQSKLEVPKRAPKLSPPANPEGSKTKRGRKP